VTHVISLKITKIDDERIGLNLNPKHKTNELKQEHQN
jgi:hypothetical protein